MFLSWGKAYKRMYPVLKESNMHSKGNWILRRDCQAKGRSDFYNCHSPLWGSQWIFDLPLQKQRPANLGKV